jgi:integrase
MLLPLKAVISKKIRKDGNSIISFQYCFSSTNRVLLGTEIAIPRACWNAKRQCISKSLPENIGNFEILNDELLRIKKIVEAIIEHGKKNGEENIGAFVKQMFTPNFKIEILQNGSTLMPMKKKEKGFFEEYDKYIASKEKKVVPKGLGNFRTTKERLLAFQTFRKQKITFQSLDFTFYTEFVDFLTYDFVQLRKKEVVCGLKLSSIGMAIKFLRMFIKDRVRRKLIPPIDMSDFKILDEEADAIYLSYEEVGKIYNLDLSEKPTLALHRDMFVLGCLTGLRISDYSTLAGADYRNGLLYKKTNKKDTWVVIPLREEAKTVFSRTFATATPYISHAVFNKYIKEIGKLAGITEAITFSYKKGNKDITLTKPKCEWITSHTCRRSFCTNEYLAGTDINLIMKISAHKTHKDFFRYIKVTQEEAARKVQEIWLSHNKMTAFAGIKTA